MDDVDRIAQLHDQALDVRVRVIESHKPLLVELTGIWKELNALVEGRSEVRRICDEIARDIARLEKLDLEFDTEWLADARRRSETGQA